MTLQTATLTSLKINTSIQRELPQLLWPQETPKEEPQVQGEDDGGKLKVAAPQGGLDLAEVTVMVKALWDFDGAAELGASMATKSPRQKCCQTLDVETTIVPFLPFIVIVLVLLT